MIYRRKTTNWNLSLAAHLIHADFPTKEMMQKHYEQAEDLRLFLKKIRDELKPLSEDDDLSTHVQKKASSFSDLATELKNAFLRKHAKNLEFQNRTKIVLKKLESELPHHPRILVIYGAWHQPHIAAFLEDRGFKLVKTDWVPVILLKDS